MSSEGSRGAVGGQFQPEERRMVNRKVAILGHSFVRNLPLPAGIPYGVGNENVALSRRFFLPGATIESIQQGRVWQRFLEYRPNLTFLLIGGNDITSQSQPANIARAIITLAKRVRDLTCGEVKIITIENRPAPHRISAVRYNRQRTSINRYLKHRDPFTVGRLVFAEATDRDSQDGVHLRDSAMEDLAHNLRWHIEQFAGRNW